MEKRKLFIGIDGNSLMHRAYYALPSMTSREGAPTGAVFGFLNMLMKVLERKPDYLLVAFDMHGPTFRHATFADYKAGRRETPEDLRPQFPLVQEILKQMGVCVCTCETFEADDILGTFAKKAEEQGINALVVTGDKDALQLISDTTHVLLTKKGITETAEMDKAALKEAYGLTPERMKDLKGLMGDNSDNIPGIPGGGEKTALKLLQEYETLENVLAHAADIKGKLGEKVAESADLARMSYGLGVIDTKAPVECTLEDSRFHAGRLAGGRGLLAQYQLFAIMKRLPEGEANMQEKAPRAERGRKESVLLKDMNGVEEAAAALKNAKEWALCMAGDTLAVAGDAQKEYRMCFSGTLLEPGLDPAEVFACLRPSLEDAGIAKLLFDAKKWMHMLASYKITLAGVAFDAMIADYLLNATQPASELQSLLHVRTGSNEVNACDLFALAAPMLEELKEKDLDELYNTMELPLTGVLYRMEKQGFLVDTAVLNELNAQFAKTIDALAADIYEQAGETFNILSPKQLGAILFEKLQLPAQRKTKTGYSTDAEVLEALADAHPVVNLVQEYRFLTKLKSTFVDGLLAAIFPADGRVHTSFNQNVTATGRISSTDPNLQNIPVRTQQGREIRKAFVASPGCVLVGADYSQIELRLLAHISGDETMINAFLNGGDIHARTASEVFGVPLDQVEQSQRSAAKAVNFGIVYGISDFGLARNLGIGKKQAGEYIQKYLDKYPGVRAYMQKSVQDGKEQGYVKTILGRRRGLPELSSSQYNTRSFGERVAMNMPIQGSAADIIKLAMVHVDEALQARNMQAKLILQVHDELILDVPAEEVDQAVELVRDCMQNAMRLCVPLEADVRVGHSWYETK